MDNLDRIMPDNPDEKRNRPLVLVTGATGTLGRVLVSQLLKNNYRVRALVRKISKKSIDTNDIEIFYGDITDQPSLEAAFDKVDYVVHAAADTLSTSFEKDVSTISGTKNIVLLCKKYKLKKLIYISTCNVYGVADYPSGYKIDEDSPLEQFPEKRGSYTNTKLIAETLIQEEIKSGNINAVCLRPGTYFGVGTDYFTALIGFSVKNRLFITIGHKNLRLPLVCTENVADAIVLMLENSKCNGNTYNIIDNNPVTKDQYIKLFIKNIFPGAGYIHVPFWLLYSLIIIQERIFSLLGIRPILTKYRYLSSQNNVVYLSDKIHKELLWNAPYEISDMMNKIIVDNKIKKNKGLVN